jgi:hypothetical protein
MSAVKHTVAIYCTLGLTTWATNSYESEDNLMLKEIIQHSEDENSLNNKQ